MWPVFTVCEIQANNALVGELSSTTVGQSTWVDEGWVGHLKLGDRLFYGRWHADGDRWRFNPDSPLPEVSVGSALSAIDSYWGERMAIVLNATLTWSQRQWTDSPDHNHCDICWATISTFESVVCYVSSQDDIVCDNCYRKHIMQRDCSFVPGS